MLRHVTNMKKTWQFFKSVVLTHLMVAMALVQILTLKVLISSMSVLIKMNNLGIANLIMVATLEAVVLAVAGIRYSVQLRAQLPE